MFSVGGNSSVMVPKSQIVFGEAGNDTTAFVQLVVSIFEPLHEKTNNLHLRKQRRRSAVQ